jgi:hypothetical protein
MAATNVIELPTAAKSKVRQPAARNARRFCAAMDELPRFPMELAIEPSPYVKKCREEAALMLDTGEAAIMQMALAVFSVLSDEQRIRVHGRLLALSLLNRSGAKEAMAWLAYESASKERKRDIDVAGSFIAKERGL